MRVAVAVAIKFLPTAIACAVFFGLSYIRDFPVRSYSGVVLKQDADLLDAVSGEVVGHLKRGVVLFAPHAADMGFTDPGDATIHKLLLRLPHVSSNDIELLPLRGSRLTPKVRRLHVIPDVAVLARGHISETNSSPATTLPATQ